MDSSDSVSHRQVDTVVEVNKEFVSQVSNGVHKASITIGQYEIAHSVADFVSPLFRHATTLVGKY